MDQTLHKQIFLFLQGEKGNLASISTISPDSKPHSASVYFTMDKDLNIYFSTRMNSRKYKNLLNNPSIAFLISSLHPQVTLQLEGTASLVTNSDEQRMFFSEILNIATVQHDVPPIAQMMTSEIAIMKITPAWARLGNFGGWKNKDVFHEISFQN